MLQFARIIKTPMRTAIAKQWATNIAVCQQRRKPMQPMCRSINSWSTISVPTLNHPVNQEVPQTTKLSFVERFRVSCDDLHLKTCLLFFSSVQLNSETSVPLDTPVSGSDVVVQAAEMIGEGKWIDWIRATRPVQFTIHSLEYLHATTGLGWAPTFVLAAIITRVCILPLVFYQARVIHEISRLRPHFAYIQQIAAKSEKSKLTVVFETTRLRWLLYRKYKCHPVKLLLPGITQLGILACVAVSIRPLIYTSPSIQTAGALWLTDLTMPDPWFVLPVTISALFYLQGVVADRYGKANAARKQQELEAALRPSTASTPVTPLSPSDSKTVVQRDGKTVTIIPGTFWDTFNYYKGAFIIVVMPFAFSLLPSGLAIFQMTGAVWSLVQLTVMQSSAMKSFLGLDTQMRPLLRPKAATVVNEADEAIRSDIRNLYSKTSGKALHVIDPKVPAPIQFYEGELKGSTSNKSKKKNKPSSHS